MNTQQLKNFICAALLVFAMAAQAQVNLTYHYDNARDGLNSNETALTPQNVNTNTFGQLFNQTVDGYVYAQPLVMTNVTISGLGAHNVVYVATENDTVYAFDADSNSGANGGLLWESHLGTAIVTPNAGFGTRYGPSYSNIVPAVGTTGTPVIDPVSGTIYLDCATVSNGVYNHYIHALDITTGQDRSYSPVKVQASVSGTGVGGNGSTVTFNPEQHLQRPAMTLAGGELYVAFGSYGDTDPYHGWVMAYNATNLQQTSVFCTTPNATTGTFGAHAGEGALWMCGNGLSVDANTNLYFEIANGSFDQNTGGGDYGDSLMKVSPTLTVQDYFTPFDQATMQANDADLGSAGQLLLPDAVGSAGIPHLIIGSSKGGNIYLVNRDNMGHYNSGNNNQIVKYLSAALGTSYAVPAYFNYNVYFQGGNDVMKEYSISNATLSGTPVKESSVSFGLYGGPPVISSSGTSNGIVWVIQADNWQSQGHETLHAFNATTLSELYNSSQNLSRDNPGDAVKYVTPTAANGKVYVGAEYQLSVYGLTAFVATPAISPDGGIYTNSVTVTLSDSTSGSTIYYTTDGTTPTTSSIHYTTPFVLTNSVIVNAIGVKTGFQSSSVASASFINSSSLGSGTGLLGSYWTNTTSVQFTNVTFSTPPTLTRTDAVVDFNWNAAGPDPRIGNSNYCVSWTGSVQPQFSGTYTFYTTTDDGVQLWVNGQLLINHWANQALTTYQSSITLNAQQLYTIKMNYFDASGGASADLQWSGPSTVQADIPQTQLYPYTNPPPTVILSSPANNSVYTASASVTMGAMADTPYNPISSVAFYANGMLLGTLTNSPNAPLYTITTTGLNPPAGGESANSSQVSATPSSGKTTLTTTNVQAVGANWTAAIWQTNGTGTAVAAVAGNNYVEVYNGTGVAGDVTGNNTRVRSPLTTGSITFPGDMLTLNTNTELRGKGAAPSTLNFPGVGGNPGLVLNGGVLDNQDTAAQTTVNIAGSIQVLSQSYLWASIATPTNLRAINISGYLSGNGNLVVMDCVTNLPQVISGTTNTYSGQWIVQCGWLQGAVTNSLGTNSITVDPNYTGYLNAMPLATSSNGPAVLEVNYNIDSGGTLTLTNGGLMSLHQNCTFAGAVINGVSLTNGTTYSYSTLAATYPNNFLPGGSGSITIQNPYIPPDPPLMTTTNVQAVGANWTNAIWQTNGTGTAVAPVAGMAYATIYNGTGVAGDVTGNNTRIRSPLNTGTVTFPGDSLTVNTNTELRCKGAAPSTVNFPGVGGNPGLILNGGVLDNQDTAAQTTVNIAGSIQVLSQSYLWASIATPTNLRAINISGYLSGNGNLVVMDCVTNLPQVISGTTNTYSGQWIVQCGWLQGTNANSLGTNSITVDPNYTGYLNAMPLATSSNGPAVLEVNYDIGSSGTLTLTNGGLMKLHQNCTFAAVVINGTSLSSGTHPYSELASNFPNNFLPGGSGGITVSSLSGPTGLIATAGNTQVSLSWNAVSGATSYNVKRSTTSGGPYTTITNVTTTSYTDTGLANGTTYYYVVSAVFPGGSGSYTLTAVATDGSSLSTTSAPVNITVNAGSGQPYGLTSNGTVTAFLNGNMPTVIPAILPGNLPLTLSGTGAYGIVTNRTPASGLIPYIPNTPLWSDNAQKSRYLALPSHGGPITPDEQITFLPTNTWTFPAGTVFVKNFDLSLNQTSTPNYIVRLETRLLVRDTNGAVYGVTYKWRPDNSDADLLTTSSNQDFVITNIGGTITTQTWYYPSPADCLTCHTPVANYVLGVNTRQLNNNDTYPATGVTDNQLRTLNRLGLLNPAINEANITNFEALSSVTNVNASFQQRARSYLDANCAQCHQPGGSGITFDARYDTPLAQQNITNYPAAFPLVSDNACIIRAQDIWRSMIYVRINTNSPSIMMPPLARHIIDTNAVNVFAGWINSLPGIPALAPPNIIPAGGTFNNTVSIAVTAGDTNTNATFHYTLDGSLPTTNSTLYSGAFNLSSNATVTANAWLSGFFQSAASSSIFFITNGSGGLVIMQPINTSSNLTVAANVMPNHQLQFSISSAAGRVYVLEGTTNFSTWTPIATNTATGKFLYMVDPNATNFPYRFYRILQQ